MLLVSMLDKGRSSKGRPSTVNTARCLMLLVSMLDKGRSSKGRPSTVHRELEDHTIVFQTVPVVFITGKSALFAGGNMPYHAHSTVFDYNYSTPHNM